MTGMSVRQLSAAEEQTIAALTTADMDALYRELGLNVGTLEGGGDPIVQAKTWLSARQERLRRLICTKGRYCELAAQHPKVPEIVGALADLLAPIFGTLPVYTLATLLVRQGLDDLCHCKADLGRGA